MQQNEMIFSFILWQKKRRMGGSYFCKKNVGNLNFHFIQFLTWIVTWKPSQVREGNRRGLVCEVAKTIFLLFFII
jgi:hypothetical protein